MILRRVIAHFKKQEWTAIGLDFLIVVVGVFIGIQVANWNEGRAERIAEERYLTRLYADTQANIAELEELVSVHERRAAILADMENALLTGGEPPPPADLHGVLCRFFVQPGVELQQATYGELVSSGNLSILRDEKLRILLSRQQAAQAEIVRDDIMTPAIQRAAAPLEDYRAWRIAAEPDKIFGGVDCIFDIDGMRADPRIPSVMAQLYRNQHTVGRFRKRVLDITLALDARLKELMAKADIPLTEAPE